LGGNKVVGWDKEPRRPGAGITAAGILLGISAIAYAAEVVVSVLNGGLAPLALGPHAWLSPLAFIAGYGPLIPLAAFLGWAIPAGRFWKLWWIGFGAWFAVAVADYFLMGGVVMARDTALSGAIPLVLVVAGGGWRPVRGTTAG